MAQFAKKVTIFKLVNLLKFFIWSLVNLFLDFQFNLGNAGNEGNGLADESYKSSY